MCLFKYLIIVLISFLVSIDNSLFTFAQSSEYITLTEVSSPKFGQNMYGRGEKIRLSVKISSDCQVAEGDTIHIELVNQANGEVKMIDKKILNGGENIFYMDISPSHLTGYETKIRVCASFYHGTYYSNTLKIYSDQVAPSMKIEWLEGIPSACTSNLQHIKITVDEKYLYSLPKVSVQTQDGGKYDFSGWIKKGTRVEGELTLKGEGSYHISAECRDLAGNKTGIDWPWVSIDQTKPDVSIACDGKKVEDSMYLDAKELLITIEDLNLNPNDLEIEITENGQPKAYSVSSISKNKKQIKVSSLVDGKYVLSWIIRDYAGNTNARKQMIFYIDQTLPTGEITGMKEQKIWTDLPTLFVKIKEKNIETISINISGEGSKTEKLYAAKMMVLEENHKYRITLPEYLQDDTYTIQVKIKDSADHVLTLHESFVLNRKGSQFVIDGLDEKLNDDFNRKIVRDMSIVISNVSRIQSIEVLGGYHGHIYPLENNRDYQLEFKQKIKGKNIYELKISQELFSENGLYILECIVMDEAWHVQRLSDQNTYFLALSS